MLATHTHALPPGTRLSQYEITGVLGSGGFGITYLAQDLSLDAPVAIKEYLPTELATREEGQKVTAVSTTARTDFKWGLDRFLDEARVLAKFRHPHIVHIFQVFEANNTAYIVMEFAKGESLSALLQRVGQIGEAQTRQILFPIMDGLKRVHERGFLHRDIKPGNIILREDGGPALIDFGAARQAIETKSRSITSIITEGYAPLEQYDAQGNQGPWTDIYALGAVAYKCLAGKTPPAATSRIRNDPMEPLAKAAPGRVSPELDAAIVWALKVYEEERPKNIDEFARAMTETSRPPAQQTPPDEATRLEPQRPAAPSSSAAPSGVAPTSAAPPGAPAASAAPADVTRLQSAPSGAAPPDVTRVEAAQASATRVVDSLDVAAESTQLLGRAKSADTGASSAKKSFPLVPALAGGGAVLAVAAVAGWFILSPAGKKSEADTKPPVVATAPASTPAAEPAVSYAREVSGTPTVIDTATLDFGDRKIVIAGLSGLAGDPAKQLAYFIQLHGKTVTCSLVNDGPGYQCITQLDHTDIGEAALLNGAARTNADSTNQQRNDEAKARLAKIGLWAE